MLGSIWIAAATALDPEAGVNLESGFATIVRDEFRGNGAFPVGAITLGVLVDPLRSVEIVRIYGDGKGWIFLKSGNDFVGIVGICLLYTSPSPRDRG